MPRRPPGDLPTVAALRGHPRLRSYVRESYAVHRRTDLGTDLAAQLHAWQLLMTDGGCFTALTSAELRGWWLPPLPQGTPVFMALEIDDPRPMRAGVRTSRHTRAVGREEIGGLRCATAVETLLGCARWLCLIDLVILVDCALHRGDCTVDEIRDVIAPRRPGARALAHALAHADRRSESAYETLLRLLHVLCGIEVEPQFIVLGAHGHEIARADLRITGTTGLPEFDGDEHEKGPRRVKDRRRDRALEKAGYVRRGYTAGDVLRRGVTILEDADRSLGRPHDPSRIRPWHEQLRRSLFTPSGTADYLARAVPTLPVRRRRPSDDDAT
ncbi:hypothetical protein KDN32_07175 [Nocardioides sp. J2M5]|uniref:hypothetical protein n=1 Tax=Nocardioides palaemonis TaxID=2829810 RepID=UPI001BAD7757|nr:hypothetical protein [Nocardioides palaemonis]MBS2937519.1 hypothetical protein [Nocardioides palaemonis]